VTAPWDPGLQPERTTLAWSRTGLALATAGLVLARLAVARSGTAAALAGVLAGLCVVVSGLALARAPREHAADDVALRQGRPVAGALLPAAMAAAALSLGAGGALYVLA
jgi:uncharacterized membrane protein YidH (DUF202 family)